MVAPISLKQAIYDKFVQLREYGEAVLGHSHEQISENSNRHLG